MLPSFDTLHIAFQDDEYPCIVPMNFGIGDDEDKIVLYIYTPGEKKDDLPDQRESSCRHIGRKHYMNIFVNQIRLYLILIHLL